MSDLDLTEAVDAAAQALFRHQYPDVRGTWDDVMPMTKHTLREIVLPVVTAAAPLIAAQARAETLREAADAWTRGAWADTPRRPDRVVERIAASQYVGDWLRRRAAAPTITPLPVNGDPE